MICTLVAGTNVKASVTGNESSAFNESISNKESEMTPYWIYRTRAIMGSCDAFEIYKEK